MKSNPIKQEKLRKLKELLQNGVDPYPHTWRNSNWENKTSIKELLDNSREEADPEKFFCVAGRLMRKRPMGKADFFNLEDERASLQCYIRKDDFKLSLNLQSAYTDNSSLTASKSNLNSAGSNKSLSALEKNISADRENKLNPWKLWKLCDIGDILSVRGQLFKTKRGELSLRIHDLKILCKSVEALPEKYHGLEDKELKYRYRHMDLIMDQKSRVLFKIRSQVITEIRNYMNGQGFTEVETPVLQSVYGGAVAEPFETRFRRLNQKMYLKISPEIYLKKLIVGGFEKVYEIGKNFRNEGIDRTHNPEFTMMEYYEAYTDYKDQMGRFKKLVNHVVQKIKGSLQFEYQGRELNFNKWETLSVKSAVKKYSQLENSNHENLKSALEVLQKSQKDSLVSKAERKVLSPFLKNPSDQESLKESKEWQTALTLSKQNQEKIKFLDPDNISFPDFFNFIKELEPKGDYQKFEQALSFVAPLSKEMEEHLKGELTVLAFEILAEEHLWNPTFIIDFPLSVSPLTKKHRDSKHSLVERFEPYIAGMELGNAYTELNDSIDQRQRLEKQERWSKKQDTVKIHENFQPQADRHSRESGNPQRSNPIKNQSPQESSHPIDENFIHALELGMPPTGGVGLGIERLVMILMDQKSIRDCILFPALKDKS